MISQCRNEDLKKLPGGVNEIPDVSNKAKKNSQACRDCANHSNNCPYRPFLKFFCVILRFKETRGNEKLYLKTELEA